MHVVMKDDPDGDHIVAVGSETECQLLVTAFEEAFGFSGGLSVQPLTDTARDAYEVSRLFRTGWRVYYIRIEARETFISTRYDFPDVTYFSKRINKFGSFGTVIHIDMCTNQPSLIQEYADYLRASIIRFWGSWPGNDELDRYITAELNRLPTYIQFVDGAR